MAQYNKCNNCGAYEKYLVVYQGKHTLVCKHKCKVNHAVGKCTCSSSSQIGMCQWCIDKYSDVYSLKED